MNFEFDEKWLEKAIQIEDEAGYDAQAGLDLGRNSGAYIAAAKSYIDHEKLMLVLKEGMGDLLTLEELEAFAIDFQNRVRDRVIEKFHADKTA